MERVEEHERRPGVLMTLASIVLCLACLILSAMNVTGRGPFARRAPAPSERQLRDLVAGDLLFAIREIEMAIEESGEIPDDLSGFEFAREPGWSYARVGDDTFVLTLADGGYLARFDSRRGSEAIEVRSTR